MDDFFSTLVTGFLLLGLLFAGEASVVLVNFAVVVRNKVPALVAPAFARGSHGKISQCPGSA